MTESDRIKLKAPEGVLPLAFDVGRHLSGELPSWIGLSRQQIEQAIQRNGRMRLTLRGKYRAKGKRALRKWEHTVILVGPFASVDDFLYSVHRALREKMEKL